MARLFVAAILFGMGAAAIADAEPVPNTVNCPKQDGMAAGPYVPTKDTAAKIYAIVGRAMFSDIFAKLQKKYPVIAVEDQGSSWLVNQTRAASSKPKNMGTDGPIVGPDGSEYVIVQAGGGMLTMTIDKCTGAISDMYFAR